MPFTRICQQPCPLSPTHDATPTAGKGKKQKARQTHPHARTHTHTKSQCLRQLALSKMKLANGDGSRGSLACSETAQVTQHGRRTTQYPVSGLAPLQRRRRPRRAIGRARTISQCSGRRFPLLRLASSLSSLFPLRFPLAPPPAVLPPALGGVAPAPCEQRSQRRPLAGRRPGGNPGMVPWPVASSIWHSQKCVTLS